jgi:hypothetical protein
MAPAQTDRFELARLDERMLRDIGLTRFDAEYEINKHFGGNDADGYDGPLSWSPRLAGYTADATLIQQEVS